MKRLPIIAFLILSTLFARAAQPTGNIPISAMAEATNALDTAYVPIIQPYPGRTTNDNFKVSVASLFDARPQAIITNLTVYNFTVISNFFSTTTNITAYEITVTNNISHDRIFISTNITINGFDINTWTNDASIFHPTINRGAGPLDYSFLVASNIVRVDDGRMSGTETWVSKSVALNIGDNQLPVAGSSQWNLIGPTSNPDDTTISLMNGITDAQKLVIYNITNAVPASGAFKLTNGTPIPDSLSGGITRLMGGRDWVATNGSWIMLEFHSPDWVEMDDRNVFTGAGGADTWHVVSGILQPVDLTLPVYWTNAVSSVSLSGDYFINSPGGGGSVIRYGANSLNGNARIQSDGAIELGNLAFTKTVVPDSNDSAELGSYHGSGGRWLHSVVKESIVVGYDSTTTATNYSWLKIYHTGTNGDVVLDSQASGIAGGSKPVDISFNGTNLFGFYYDTSPYFSIKPLTGAGEARFLYTVGGGAMVQSSSALPVWITPNAGSTGDYVFSSTGFTPDVDNSMDIGGAASNAAFRDIFHKGKLYTEGMNDGAGNYSRSAIYHTGTNGLVVIESQAAGTAGTARPIDIKGSPTDTSAEYDANATANETRLLLWDVTAGSLRRVSIGVNDSGGAGFRVLRIPN